MKKAEFQAALAAQYRSGFEAGLVEGQRRRIEDAAAQRKTEDARIRSNSIDAIAHAVTALAKLVEK